MDLKSELLFTMYCHLQTPQDIGETPFGRRQIFHLENGHIEGERLTGEFLPGGGDWFLMRPDGIGEFDMRGTIRTESSDLIYVTYMGVLNIQPEVWQRIIDGEAVTPEEYYFRITPRFQTGSEEFSWLNNIMTIGLGEISTPIGTQVKYTVYQIL